MLTTHDPTKIAALNDAARKSFSGCRVYMTPGVQALYQTQAIVARVQAYDAFTERNDPYGECLTSAPMGPNSVIPMSKRKISKNDCPVFSTMRCKTRALQMHMSTIFSPGLFGVFLIVHSSVITISQKHSLSK